MVYCAQFVSQQKAFICRSAKLTGPFVQMIYSMIAGDMIRFAIISAIFLVSFSQGLTYISFLKYAYFIDYRFKFVQSFSPDHCWKLNTIISLKNNLIIVKSVLP